ncbi:TonB-dependent receptor [Alloacidobacterium dinghuense]|uniref:TonB-dependent receptor n=1 Tax=Alloacidobacterium dinghuense TaxID=2763107 RepID=A0A7G8BLD9_9BACT|nr:TonB-dependent receptor [Alloacidobacterium dinghuense]QNI33359.1 TonB-dependent receptor [Alloacidobacterium dinghuense]
MLRLLTISLLLAISATSLAQTPPAVTPAPAAPPASSAQTGGTIHGAVKSGATPLPGVSITATNTLTGKKYSTVTDAAGAYSLTIPQNGRYVLKTDFAAFAATTKEALLNATSHDQQADFALTLASRATQQEGSEQTAQLIQNLRQYAGNGALNLSMLSGASDLIQAGSGGGGSSDAQLPTLANNSDFSSESVAVSGQSGTTNPFAGIDFNQMRQNMEDNEFNQSLSQTPGRSSRGGGQDSAFGGPGGFGGGGGRGGFGGRGNFRNFKPNQPHGAFFWNGGNSALNAEPFSIRGAELNQPAYQSNHFGLTFVGAPYIPKILTKDTKDFLFFTLAGNYTSSPFNQYGTVPTAAERAGDLSALTTQSGQPVTIYNPPASSTPGGVTCTANGNVPGQPFVGNRIPASCISPQATQLLNYVPQQNLPGAFQNYQRISTAQTNTTNVGVRFVHNFGSSAGGSPMIGMIRQVMGQGSNTLRQTINFNFNYSHNAADELSIFPDLGGKQQTHQYSLQAGYTIGKNKLTNNLTAGWNRSDTQLLNYFTNTTDVASQLGINVFNGATSPLNFGLPSVTLTQFTGLNEQQPNLHVNQTISITESSSWIHHKNNFKFGGDFRRVHLDMIGQANSTGSFYFTGLFTRQPGSPTNTTPGVSTTGSDLADLLLGFPQQSALQAPYQKAYLRENVYDLFAQDSWQALPNFTVNAGLRYEYFSPYSEKDDRLVNLDVGNDFTTVVPVQPNQVGPFSGKYPSSLINPERNDFSPRIGIAWRAIKDTVIRAGYGINFANGQYAKFVQDFAFQPPFADVQTNESTTGADITLANGFPAPQDTGNYAVNKRYRLPYVQVWNLDIQRTLPLGIVLNVGYNGSKGTRLDVVSAPGRTATESLSGVFYDWEDSIAFSNFNALAVRLRKRMQHGIALGATYTYSHSIDNASSVGGVGGVVAQNWQDILAEESNSSFDVRQQIKGDFVYELPFGPDTHMLTNGSWLSHALANISMSGTFDFATGEPLTPHYQANIDDVARGSAGSLRPDRVPGASLTEGGGTIRNWFNRDAFTQPVSTYGTATRYSIPGPGTVSFNASLSKSVRFGDMRSLEVRATSNNVFNTVQYAGVDTTVGSATYGQVTSAANMRQFTFLARYRF